MDYKEALKKLETVKWRTAPCTVVDCWCCLIVPDNPITYTYKVNELEREETLDYIIGSGSIPKETAEYIVKIHNETLKQNKKIEKFYSTKKNKGN